MLLLYTIILIEKSQPISGNLKLKTPNIEH